MNYNTYTPSPTPHTLTLHTYLFSHRSTIRIPKQAADTSPSHVLHHNLHGDLVVSVGVVHREILDKVRVAHRPLLEAVKLLLNTSHLKTLYFK